MAEPVVVEAWVRARLFGIRLLSVDARVVVSPAPSADGVRDGQPIGGRLAEAARVLGEGAASLEAARGAALGVPNGRGGRRPARHGSA